MREDQGLRAGNRSLDKLTITDRADDVVGSTGRWIHIQSHKVEVPRKNLAQATSQVACGTGNKKTPDGLAHNHRDFNCLSGRQRFVLERRQRAPAINTPPVINATAEGSGIEVGLNDSCPRLLRPAW